MLATGSYSATKSCVVANVWTAGQTTSLCLKTETIEPRAMNVFSRCLFLLHVSNQISALVHEAGEAESPEYHCMFNKQKVNLNVPHTA